MKQYQEMTREQLQDQRQHLEQTYAQLKAKGLKLNMARGKPGADQLELSAPMLDVLNSKSDCHDSSGVDCRNYGELLGIPEARQLFANYMGVAATSPGANMTRSSSSALSLATTAILPFVKHWALR